MLLLVDMEVQEAMILMLLADIRPPVRIHLLEVMDHQPLEATAHPRRVVMVHTAHPLPDKGMAHPLLVKDMAHPLPDKDMAHPLLVKDMAHLLLDKGMAHLLPPNTDTVRLRQVDMAHQEDMEHLVGMGEDLLLAHLLHLLELILSFGVGSRLLIKIDPAISPPLSFRQR